jgi:hypothetical protein
MLHAAPTSLPRIWNIEYVSVGPIGWSWTAQPKSAR